MHDHRLSLPAPLDDVQLCAAANRLTNGSFERCANGSPTAARHGKLPVILPSASRRVCESIGGGSLAKPNYKFQKRQKDLAKQKKKEEKRLKKAARTGEQPGEGA